MYSMSMIINSNDQREKINLLSKEIVNVFYLVHKNIGPGLLESIYEEIICYELSKRNIGFTRQTPIPVIYEDKKLELGFRADIIVENSIIIEIKSIEAIAPVHYKQLLSYLKLSDKRLGFLVNFNVELIKDGMHRMVNKF